MADLSSVGFSDPDLEAMRTQLRKMNDQELRLGLGVLLFLAWGISYIVFHVAGVLIHLLLVFALAPLRKSIGDLSQKDKALLGLDLFTPLKSRRPKGKNRRRAGVRQAAH
jgi:hypothetical protein